MACATLLFSPSPLALRARFLAGAALSTQDALHNPVGLPRRLW
ncbi:MAG TPA: hypothetical protein VHO48_04075 [Anaerolineaceae bacterium]|nr:hypothetical protein [Anaerolineaceae bacterium]